MKSTAPGSRLRCAQVTLGPRHTRDSEYNLRIMCIRTDSLILARNTDVRIHNWKPQQIHWAGRGEVDLGRCSRSPWRVIIISAYRSSLFILSSLSLSFSIVILYAQLQLFCFDFVAPRLPRTPRQFHNSREGHSAVCLPRSAFRILLASSRQRPRKRVLVLNVCSCTISNANEVRHLGLKV
jgi:hypothetical protein